METDPRNQADEGHLRDGAGAQLGAAHGQGAVQDDRPAHVAVHVAPPPVQEDPHRGHQEDQEEELPLLQALRARHLTLLEMVLAHNVTTPLAPLHRVRPFNLGLHFFASKVAFSCSSVDRFGKKCWGLMTLGQVKMPTSIKRPDSGFQPSVVASFTGAKIASPVFRHRRFAFPVPLLQALRARHPHAQAGARNPKNHFAIL